MRPPSLNRLFWGLPLCALLLSATVSAGTISDVIFRIEAENDQGAGFLEFNSSELTYNPSTNQWTWTTGQADILNGGGDPIAMLDGATLKLVSDPNPGNYYYIELGFAVAAGLSDTHFRVESAQLSFTEIPPELLQGPMAGGRATASLGATDADGDGVEFAATGSVGAGAYRGQYNGFVPDGTTFAELVNTFSAGPGGSGSAGQSLPAGAGYATIAESVQDMSAQLDFMLTDNDAGSGTTTYRILPEPASGLALALLGLGVLRRRR